MKQALQRPEKNSTERASIRRRVRQMVDGFNHDQWEKCFALIDPRLRKKGAVHLATYSDTLTVFKRCYGRIDPWYVRISLHLDALSNKNDPRAFAYVYVVWQDERREFHIFKERWVKHEGQWFTRVLGLVANRAEAGAEK